MRSRKRRHLVHQDIPLIFGLLLACAGVSRADSFEDAPKMAADILKSGGSKADWAPKVGKLTIEPTALQRHVAFFDKDADGLITRSETELSLRQLGFGLKLARTAALVIHLAVGPETTGSLESLDISVSNINRGKHGSDTGVFDAKGRFVPPVFERMFFEFDRNRSGSLSEAEIDAMITVNSQLRPGKKFASILEFQLLMLIAADATEEVAGQNFRALSKERLRQLYDGTLFYTLASQPVP